MLFHCPLYNTLFVSYIDCAEEFLCLTTDLLQYDEELGKKLRQDAKNSMLDALEKKWRVSVSCYVRRYVIKWFGSQLYIFTTFWCFWELVTAGGLVCVCV